MRENESPGNPAYLEMRRLKAELEQQLRAQRN